MQNTLDFNSLDDQEDGHIKALLKTGARFNCHDKPNVIVRMNDPVRPLLHLLSQQQPHLQKSHSLAHRVEVSS
jgi:hypothetical protein